MSPLLLTTSIQVLYYKSDFYSRVSFSSREWLAKWAWSRPPVGLVKLRYSK